MLTRYTRTVWLWLAAAVWLAGCATSGDPVVDTSSKNANALFEVSGSVLYRERILLPPGSLVTVSLEDISVADAASVSLAEQQVVTRGEQVPIPFALAVAQSTFKPTGRYSLRATIHDAEGALRWTTDTVNLIDPRRIDTNMDKVLLIMMAVGS